MNNNILAKFEKKYNLKCNNQITTDIYDFAQYTFTSEQIKVALRDKLTFDELLNYQFENRN